MGEDRKFVHSLMINKRETASVTGVFDVISFDLESVVAETEMGVLIINGTKLHVSKLCLEDGILEIDGEIAGFNYEDQCAQGKSKQSILGKLFK